MSTSSPIEFLSENDTDSSISPYSNEREYENQIAYFDSMSDGVFMKIHAKQLNTNLDSDTEESSTEEDDVQVEKKDDASFSFERDNSISSSMKRFNKLVHSVNYCPRLEDLRSTSLLETISDTESHGAAQRISEGQHDDRAENKDDIEDDNSGKVEEPEEDVCGKEEEKDKSQKDEEEGEEEEDEEEWPFLDSSSGIIELVNNIHKGDDMFDIFLETYEKRTIDIKEPVSHTEALYEHDTLLKLVDQLLTELLDVVVGVCEERAVFHILRNKLDKRKIMNEINDQWILLKDVSNINRFLNIHANTYLRSNRIYLPKTYKTLQNNNDNYEKKTNNAYHTLNVLMGKEKYAHFMFKRENELLDDALRTMTSKVENEIQDFENLVLNTLCREKFKYLPKFIDKNFRSMAQFRKDISTLRVNILLEQHKMSVLSKRLKKTEYIGVNLKYRDYMDLETEVKNLDDRLSDRSVDVSRLHSRFCNETNIFSHFKDCKNLVQKKLELKVKCLNQRYGDFRAMRSQLSLLESERSQLRQQREEMSFQGGILEKTSLMYDYDQIVLGIEAKQKNIDELKEKYSKIVKNIKNLEKKAC